MEANGLFVPTLNKHRDVFRPAVTQEDSIAVLFNPENNDFVLDNGVLYSAGKALSVNIVFELAANPAINQPIYNNTLIYGIFTHFFVYYDPRNRTEFVVPKKAIVEHLGVDGGVKGVNLVKILAELGQVYGVIKGLGVFPLLTFEVLPETLVIHSEYMHRLLNSMLVESPIDSVVRGCYYTDEVLLSILSERNQTASLIVLELVGFLAQYGEKEIRISVSTLALRIPQLRKVLESSSSTKAKNRKLKNIFSAVYQLLDNPYIISSKYRGLSFEPVIPKISNLDLVIKLNLKRSI